MNPPHIPSLFKRIFWENITVWLYRKSNTYNKYVSTPQYKNEYIMGEKRLYVRSNIETGRTEAY